MGIEFICDQLFRFLSVTDISRAAWTSSRTAHRAFVAELGVWPMAFVRRQRLQAARRHLLQTKPTETTGADAARTCSFTHFGRFSALYREAFREAPSETLGR